MKQLTTILLLIISLGLGAQAPYMSGPNGQRLLPKARQTKAPVIHQETNISLLRIAPERAGVPDIEWQPAILIQKGGVYSGNFKSTDGSAAIQINTTERVEIKNFNAISNGETVIQGYGGSNVYIHDGNVYANPDGNKQYGKINLWGSRSVRIERCNLNHTGGILIEQWQGSPDSPLVIRYNIGKNTDKRRGDGSAGNHRAFIQLSTVKGLKNCEIAWNQSINIADSSYIEDNINLYNTSGAPGFPIKVHDNYIQGAHPFPASAGNFTGSGITADGDPGTNSFETVTAYIDAYNNQVTDCQNALMNIAAGHNVRYFNNRMICASLLPNGQSAPGYWGGCAKWDGSNVGPSVYKDNSIANNVIGYVRKDFNVPLPNRQDYVVVNGSPSNVLPTDNTHLPNPITKAMEQAEYTTWLAKLKANGITLGPGGSAPVAIDTVIVGIADSIIIKVGESQVGRVTAVNTSGVTTSFKAGSVTMSASAGLTLTKDPADETMFTITGKTAGRSTITVSLTTNGGKVLSKVVTVTVVPDPAEATEIRIKLPYHG